MTGGHHRGNAGWIPGEARKVWSRDPGGGTIHWLQVQREKSTQTTDFSTFANCLKIIAGSLSPCWRSETHFLKMSLPLQIWLGVQMRNTTGHLSKLLKVFVQIAKYVSQTCKVYLSKLLNVFVKLSKCICKNLKLIFQNCKMYLSKLDVSKLSKRSLLVPCISTASLQLCFSGKSSHDLQSAIF